MQFWEQTPENIWQGRDDSAESPSAKRIFQTVQQASVFAPEKYPNHIALMGFMCDKGVELNKGRVGAATAPNIIRQGMANFADHEATKPLVDLGNVIFQGDSLPAVQAAFAEHITACHQNGLPTLVFGGGHETAYAHAKGLYDAYPDARIGIINFDAHLDVRKANTASSGTPFKQLAEECQNSNRPFNYLCVGVSRASNTKALLDTANELNVKIIWDTECTEGNIANLNNQVNAFLADLDVVYLTIDLDALPFAEMFAVSAPSTLGVRTQIYLILAETIISSNKLKAVDLVEYNPSLDRDMLCAKTAARIAWHIYNSWANN
ncbi:formimidoylglutamase [Wohlfahrtiimonas populi]|uniref:formimidoylglutamase n=1 Tax=Wohlfahrtiimonas populi TaxID=1940240 RepID=UPI00098D4098|nr:formimidoylglutamase [Wohlfahrtiimonas populi]